MAAGDLTITLTENVELAAGYGGETRAYTNTKTISNIVNTFHRVVKCTNDVTTTVMSFNSDAHGANQALDLEGTKYVRFTNLDTSNTIHLLFIGASDNFTVELQPGASHMMGPSDNYLLAASDTTPQTGKNAGGTTILEDLSEIAAHPIGTAVVNLEIFAAGIAPA
tara:strand:- start:105 stop:602 length:498 start_codon:yes stop_codon:yes gene_type:complete